MTAPVLLCLHGLGRSAADWDGVRPRLEQLGRVVAPELPRHAEHAQAVAASASPDGAIVLGHSMGAVTAMRLAAEPGRGILGVVLTSSFFPPALNGRSVAASLADYAGHRLAFVRGHGRPPAPPRSSSSRASASLSGDRLAINGLGYLAATAVHSSQFRATTAAVTAPVLVVHAADDHYVPVDFALAAAGGHPRWRLSVLDEGGHYPQLAASARWLDVVEPWLRELLGDG